MLSRHWLLPALAFFLVIRGFTLFFRYVTTQTPVANSPIGPAAAYVLAS